jgi:hypothetical protein
VAGRFFVVILPPGEPDDQQVKRCKQKQKYGMGVEESVKLEDAKKSEDDHRERIGP